MNDVFARIGLALTHLLNQSTVHGPAREEVDRLSLELQTFESGITAIIDARVQAAVEKIQGELEAKFNLQLTGLAETLEGAVDFATVSGADTGSEPDLGASSVAGSLGDDVITEASTVGEGSVSGGAGEDVVDAPKSRGNAKAGDPAPEATAPQNTTIMVEGGGSDVIG